MIVMETRWCGSKLLYFMWIVSVWITVLSMSYCSIIGQQGAVFTGISKSNKRKSPHLIAGRSQKWRANGIFFIIAGHAYRSRWY